MSILQNYMAYSIIFIRSYIKIVKNKNNLFTIIRCLVFPKINNYIL